MRQDPVAFARLNTAAQRRPRFVVGILFDVGSIYATSHADIPNVPGIVLQRVLDKPSAISQRITPDEGRSEIGSFSFALIDRNGQFTDQLRAKLDSGRGLRNRQVKLWVGFEGLDFSEFQLFQTQIVIDAAFSQGRYDVSCKDVTRELRKEIFEPVYTQLRLPIGPDDNVIPVYDTLKFLQVAHGPSYSDAPNATVGYLKIEKEVVRYTGKTADTFIGVTRGVLNTKNVAHNVDATTAAERRTKVEEYIYLELPSTKMALALQTGKLYGTANTLPAHWHLGIPDEYIRESDFTGIGVDLWDPTNDNVGFIQRFIGPKKTDGKRFIETELYLPTGCFSPVYSDGSMGLRRMAQVLRGATGQLRLTRRELIRAQELTHDLDGMFNQFRVNWSHDGSEFKRVSIFQDQASMTVHGPAPIKQYSFKGLYGARHTNAIVRSLLDRLRDRYAAPPQRMEVSVFGSQNAVEVGDIVRIVEPNIRDFAAPAGGLDRAFEVQQKSMDFATGEMTLSLFASTVRASVLSSTEAPAALPDAWYTSEGTALSSLLTIVANVVQPGTYDLTGNADLNSAGSIFYHDADLTIPQGVVIRVNQQAQLRIRGFLTVNGTIDGKGRGLPGVADAGPLSNAPGGTPGFVGVTQGMDGLELSRPGGGELWLRSVRAGRSAAARHEAFPYFDIRYEGGLLLGIPADLRGTSGGPGGKVNNGGGLVTLGGTGGPGGAGMVIVHRGLGFGASGRIETSGGDGAPGNLYTTDGNTYWSGGGAPGLAGGLLLLSDGSGVAVPDVTGKFFGGTGVPGYQQFHFPTIKTFLENRNWVWHSTDDKPFAGWQAPDITHFVDSSNAMHRIQFIRAAEVAYVDVDPRPPPPSIVSVAPGAGRIDITAQLPTGLPAYVELRLYSSIDNNRGNAVLFFEGRSNQTYQALAAGAQRWYWATMFDTINQIESEFYPTTNTTPWTASAGAGGQNAITARLTNQAHTLAADAAGTPISYAGASGLFEMQVGATDVRGATTFSIISNPQSLSVTINTADDVPVVGRLKGEYVVTGGFGGAPTDATVTFRAAYNGTNYDATFSLSKARAGSDGQDGQDGNDSTVPGPPGTSAKILFLDTDGELFVFTGGTAVPAAIVLTARRQNLINAVNWSTNPTVTLGGSGDVRTLAAVDIGALQSVEVTASITEGGNTYESKVKIKRAEAPLAVYSVSAKNVFGQNTGVPFSGNVNSAQGAGLNHNADATPLNGVGPFVIAWTLEAHVSGPTQSISGSTTASPTWSATGVADGTPSVAQWRCTITDTGNGNVTAFVVRTVHLEYITLN